MLILCLCAGLLEFLLTAASAWPLAIQLGLLLQVMILDWDVHHGNGTNDLFYDDDSVLMIDMHEDGVWPGSGLLNETGTGRGQGHTINIPMPSQLLLIVDLSHKRLHIFCSSFNTCTSLPSMCM